MLPIWVFLVGLAAVHGFSHHGTCRDECSNKYDGHYATCDDCNVYYRCVRHVMGEHQSCPAGRIWDDVNKACEYRSTTCHDRVACITSCHGLDDGLYPSCHGCQYFATCIDGTLFDELPCAAGETFVDAMVGCQPGSTTCTDADQQEEEPTDEPTEDPLIQQEGQDQNEDQQEETNDDCIMSCSGLTNGHYQSCLGCDFYVRCYRGELVSSTVCIDNLKWDDVLKRCVAESGTCTDTSTFTEGPNPTVSSGSEDGVCVSTCTGALNGRYQSCSTCSMFIICEGEVLVEKSCPRSLVWDDTLKRCQHSSHTCQTGTTVAPTSQPGTNPTVNPQTWTAPPRTHPTGNPQNWTASPRTNPTGKPRTWTAPPRTNPTGNPRTWTAPPRTNPTGNPRTWTAPPRTNSTENPRTWTAPPQTRPTHAPDTTTTESGSTGGRVVVGECVEYCYGIADGHYQSCKSCDVYVSCHHGRTYDLRPCQHGLFWDDSVKRCERVSTTCPSPTHNPPQTTPQREPTTTTAASTPTEVPQTAPPQTRPTHTPDMTTTGFESAGGQVMVGDCVSYCDGIANGDFQSCYGCHVYVSCYEGHTYDQRRCPTDLVWDDRAKRCLYQSSTCPSPVSTTPHREPTTTTTIAAPTTTGTSKSRCVTVSCHGLPDGNHQSCHNCQEFATCSNGILLAWGQCPRGKEWDTSRNQCVHSSTTCFVEQGDGWDDYDQQEQEQEQWEWQSKTKREQQYVRHF